MDDASQSGVQRLRGLIEGKSTAPYGKLLGFRPVEVEAGRVVFQGTPGEQHYNPKGILHGGYAASILDSCMGCAVESLLDAGFSFTTVELKVNYIRAMTADTGIVRAIGTSIHPGRRMATAEGRLLDAEGRLLAHGSTTCMILAL